MAIYRNRDTSEKLSEIQIEFESAKHTGNLGQIKKIQELLVNLEIDNRFTSPTGENAIIRRKITDLTMDIDSYLSDLLDRTFEDDIEKESQEFEY